MRSPRTPALTLCAAVTVAFASPVAAQTGDAAAGATPKKAEAAEAAEPEGPPKTKLLVIPYQPIYRSVPQDKAQTATGFLTKAFSKDDFAVIRGGRADDSAGKPSLEAAQAAAKAAEAAEAAKDLPTALAKRREVLAEMESNASALDDADQYVLAQHYLARALMWGAQDDEAKAVLAEAARMNPSFTLEPKAFSRLYRKWFLQTAKQVTQEKPGELLVKSALPGATITWDGREMDVAPVLLQKAVPGKHLLGANVQGVPPYKAIVEVVPGKKSEYRVTFGGTIGGPAVGEVTDAIATNSMSKGAIKSAVQAGKAADAAFVIAGGMSKGEDHFKMHTFVVDVKAGKMRQLDLVKFDLDLLTAEADAIRIARQVEGTTKAFADPKPMIAMIDTGVRSASTINEVDAAPDTSALSKKGRKRTKKRDGKRRVFRAIKEGEVKIKDE